MRLGKFSLCLNVKDLQTSRVFYETLGFEVRTGNEEYNWLLITIGGASFVCVQGCLRKTCPPLFPTTTTMASHYQRLLTSATFKNSSKKPVWHLNKKQRMGLDRQVFSCLTLMAIRFWSTNM